VSFSLILTAARGNKTRRSRFSPVFRIYLARLGHTASDWSTTFPPPGGFRRFINIIESGTVEASSDLVHWNTNGQANGSPDLIEAEFFDNALAPQRFYRLVSGF
jgi:hypothetical protein